MMLYSLRYLPEDTGFTLYNPYEYYYILPKLLPEGEGIITTWWGARAKINRIDKQTFKTTDGKDYYYLAGRIINDN